MPGLYGVSAADIAAELPGLFPDGFTGDTKPSETRVNEWITAADTVAQLRVEESSGVPADAGAKAAPLVKQYIREYVKAMVIRVVYAGNDPRDVDAAAAPYESDRDRIFRDLGLLGSQLETTGASVARVRGRISDRELLIDDANLGMGSRGGSGSRLF